MISNINVVVVVNSNACWVPDLSVIFTAGPKLSKKFSILIKDLLKKQITIMHSRILKVKISLTFKK